jgi:hypothetical protein
MLSRLARSIQSAPASAGRGTFAPKTTKTA